MPKTLYFLSLFLLINFLSLALFTLKVTPAFAASEDWNITINPDPVPVDAGRVTVTVKRKDGAEFLTQPNYTMIAWPFDIDTGSHAYNKCQIISRRSGFGGNYYLGSLDITKTTATASWDWSGYDFWDYPIRCREVGLLWHFRLFVGDNETAMKNPGAWIIGDYPFILSQPSGTNPVTIQAKNEGKVYGNQQPIVTILNAVSTYDYTFWWDGDKTKIAATYQKNKDPNNPTEVIIPFENFTTDHPSRKLCMEYGNFIAPPGFNDCKPNVIFFFYPAQPPPPQPPIDPKGECAIKILAAHTPILAKNDSAVVNITGLNPDQDYHVDLIKDSDKKGDIVKKKADANGYIIASLFPKSPFGLGTYSINTYDQNNNPVACKGSSFKVSENGSDIETKTCNNSTCTKGGGDTCNDSRGPAIKTAVGCIHTNPPEFAKDLLTFLVGIGGGLAFLMMLLGAFQMITSSGNPDTLKAGRERLTSAVIGLLFIIFSVLFLQIIGVDILKLPEFGR